AEVLSVGRAPAVAEKEDLVVGPKRLDHEARRLEHVARAVGDDLPPERRPLLERGGEECAIGHDAHRYLSKVPNASSEGADAPRDPGRYARWFAARGRRMANTMCWIGPCCVNDTTSRFNFANTASSSPRV